MTKPWDDLVDRIRPLSTELIPLLETCEKEREGLRHELAEHLSAARLADLAGPLAHECNNFLNVVLLQVAVLELELAETQRPLLQDIRRQAAAFKAVVHEFQAYRQRAQPEARPVDLRPVVLEAIEETNLLPASPHRFVLRTESGADGGSPPADGPNRTDVRLHAAANLPVVWTSVTELKRLIVLLLTGLAGASRGQALSIRLESVPGKVLLRFQGPAPAAESRTTVADQLGLLEWGAAQALARRLGGKLVEERQDDGSPSVVVQLDADQA